MMSHAGTLKLFTRMCRFLLISVMIYRLLLLPHSITAIVNQLLHLCHLQPPRLSLHLLMLALIPLAKVAFSCLAFVSASQVT